MHLPVNWAYATIRDMGRKLFIGLLGSLLAVVLAAPASADSDNDRQFLDALKAAGWTIRSPSLAIEHAHLVCNEGLRHGATLQDVRAMLIGYGYSRSDASTLIRQAVSTYCPKYEAAIAGVEQDLGGTSSLDQDELFVQQLNRNGIPIDKGTAVDMAMTACTSPLAGVGLYNAMKKMQQRYPQYELGTVGRVMSQGILAYCSYRLS